LSVHTDDQKILTGGDASKATVTGKIVEQGRSKKVIVLKFKKTTNIRFSAAIARTIQPCKSATSSCKSRTQSCVRSFFFVV